MTTTDTPWQSGSVDDYVAMLFQWPGFGPLLPGVVFSAVCLTIWCMRQDSSKYFCIRLGIYSGMLVSAQFMVMALLTSAFASWVAAILAGTILFVIGYLVFALGKRAKRFEIWHLLVLTTAIAVLFGFLRLFEVNPIEWIVQCGLLFLVAAPTLTPVTFVRASILVYRQHANKPTTRAWPLYVASWCVAWVVGWREAVNLMLIEYSRLPTTNPNCYVSRAAAAGHRVLVGAQQVTPGGFLVNQQMKQLKFLELVLKASSPVAHRQLRTLYDRVGPWLASQCQRSVWFADMSYLGLKPMEWSASLLRIAARVDRSRISDLYHT